MKRLHEVTITVYAMVDDDDVDDALAAINAQLDLVDTPACASFVPADELSDIDQSWSDAIPYNADDDRTCAEIFTEETRDRDHE